MVTQNTTKTGIINESKTEVERLAARIVKLPGDNNPFLKTCPSVTDTRNLAILKKLKDELTPSANKGFLGIGIVAYERLNCIEFYSALRSFPLNKGDRIIFYFDDGEEIAMDFPSVNTSFGFLKRNSFYVPDYMLGYMMNNKLDHWKLVNTPQNLSVTGGFECNEHNQQYRSKKAGQKLLQDVIKEILALKPILRSA